MTAAIYRGPTRGYKLTDEDTEWLARSLWGECGACRAGERLNETHAAAVAWAMMMRYMLVRMKWQWERWTFARFIQAFSQPVNLDWLEGSSHCEDKPEDCTADKLAKRHRCQGDTVPEAVMAVAKAFQEGKLANPFFEPVYNFASCKRTKGLNIGNNCFHTYAFLSAEGKELVVPGTVTVEKLPWLFLLLAAGALVYIAWRSWRKE